VRVRKLRKNPTDAEERLWYVLRLLKPLGMHFRGQAPVGRYFPDFVCHRSKLVIELDGSQHADDSCRGIGRKAHTQHFSTLAVIVFFASGIAM
jgi:very-short-patch-repair endonuclease